MKGRFFITMSFLAFLAIIITSAKAAPSFIMSPSQIEVPAPDQTFDVNITMTDAVNLWGWSCKVSWNSSIINCTAMTLGPFNPSGAFLLGSINHQAGEIPLLVMGTTQEDTKNGSGVLAVLTFTAIAEGDGNLEISEANYIDYPDQTKLSLPVSQTEIVVIPEFTNLLLIPLFLAICTAIVVMAPRSLPNKGYRPQ